MKITILTMLILVTCASCVTHNKQVATKVISKKQVKTKSGLIYEVVKEGIGAIARPGQTVLIHETLTLANGKQIFSSRDKNNPVKFLLGGNQVIAGVDEGVTGMKVGERRKLIVPPSLDGRTFDPEFIPHGAMLHYDIELLEIVK